MVCWSRTSLVRTPLRPSATTRFVLALALSVLSLAWGARFAAAQCVGDCDGRGTVSLAELVRGVEIALGHRPFSDCTAFDVLADERISIDELVEGVAAVLSDCGRMVITRGVCRRPGPKGLIPCADGTQVRVAMCQDRERCLSDPGALTTINFGSIGSGGHFSIALDPEMVAGATLVYEAEVEPTSSTKYRVINFGGLGPGGGAGVEEEVVIDPNTEAAVQLIDQSGLENLSDEGVETIIETVQTANADLTFAGLDADAAVAMAASEASQDPTVMMAIQEAMVTPTSTPTLTPTVTPTPIPRFILVTNIDENTVSIIDGRTNAVIDDVGVGANPIGMALTADGEHAFVVDRGTVETEGFSIIETRSRAEVARFADYEPDIPDEPVGVAITPGALAYVANRSSGSVDVIDVNVALTNPSAARVTRIFEVGNQPSVVAAARSQNFVYVSLVAGQGVAVINTRTNEVVSTVDLPAPAFSLALSPDDRTLWVTRSPNVVSVIDAELARTNPEEAANTSKDIVVGMFPLGVAVAPADDFVYVTNSGSGSESLSVIAADSQTVVRTANLPPGSSPTGIAISADGRTAYIGLRAMGSVAVVDTEKARNDPDNAVITTVTVGARPQVVVVTDLP